MPPLRCSRCQ